MMAMNALAIQPCIHVFRNYCFNRVLTIHECQQEVDHVRSNAMLIVHPVSGVLRVAEAGVDRLVHVDDAAGHVPAIRVGLQTEVLVYGERPIFIEDSQL